MFTLRLDTLTQQKITALESHLNRKRSIELDRAQQPILGRTAVKTSEVLRILIKLGLKGYEKEIEGELGSYRS